ncbi:unnamed protein product [Sympodiomycopsis kandeliae]
MSLRIRPIIAQSLPSLRYAAKSPFIASIPSIRFTSTMTSSIPKTVKALQIQSQGGLEVLKINEQVPLSPPTSNQVLIKTEYAGVNFIDTYMRSGLYKVTLPFILGNELAGVVASVGDAVKDIEAGDKVSAYVGGGAFASYIAVDRSKVTKLSSDVSTKDAAAGLLQGLTAWTLLKESYPVQKGDTVLIHAAAGGVGLLLVQMAKHLGAKVIGTVSTEEKAQLAKQNGADHIIVYTQEREKLADKVLELTGGQGVQGIYDGVGKDTWEDDFKMIARKGTIVTFGNASGAIEPFAPLKLAGKNIKVIRPTLGNYIYTQEELEKYAAEFWDLLAKKIIKLKIHGEYEFSEEGIRKSQEDITGRGTTGKLLVKIA